MRKGLPVLLILGGCCGSSAPAPSNERAPAAVTAVPVPDPPVPVTTPGVGLECGPLDNEPEGPCPVVVPPTTTPAQLVEVALWLRRTRSKQVDWTFYDDESKASEVMGSHRKGTTLPKSLAAWEQRHRIARFTRWRTDMKAPATVRVQWMWQNEQAREIPETVIDPEPATLPVLPARMQPPPKD